MAGTFNNTFLNDFEPAEFFLSQNYPNPFKDSTKIKYCVANRTRVLITVFNSDNEEIDKLVDAIKDPGTYEVEFSTCHSCLPPERDGESLPARIAAKSRDDKADENPEDKIYYYRLEADDYRCEKKMELIK